MKTTILSITGRPGLFRLVSRGRNMLIVEDIASHKRFPVHSRDKVVSLNDIAMYTIGEDKPLGEILIATKEKYAGKEVDLNAFTDDAAMRAAFAEILPDFDQDRVHNADIRKLFQWYNRLIAANIDLSELSPTTAEESEQPQQ